MSRFTARHRSVAVTAAVLLSASTVMVYGAAASNAATATPKTGGIINFLTHQTRLDAMDPAQVYTGRDISFETAYIIRTLTSFKHVADGSSTTLTPDIATNTGVPTNNAKDWSFTIRPGVKFDDGKDVTCADISYGSSRYFAQDVLAPNGPAYLAQWLNLPADPKAANGTAYPGPYKATPAQQAIWNKAVSCSADNRTVTFHLKQSIGDFNYFTTYPTTSPVQKAKDTGAKYDLKVQATGPYMIAENNKTDLKLVRNPYWTKASDPIRTPYPDQVILQYGLDQEVQDQILLSDSIPNAVGFDNVLPTNLTKFFGNTSFKGGAYNQLTSFVGYLAFNVKNIPCQQIRAAMYYARDAKAILDYAGGETYAGSYAQSLVSPLNSTDYAANGVWGPGNSNWKPGGNVAYAQSLMDQAKTACPADYAKATGAGYTIDVRTSSTLNDTIPINVAAWARIGIKVQYNIIKAGYYPTIMDPSKQSDISTSGWSQDWPNASTVIPDLYTPQGGFDLSQNTADPSYKAFEAKVTAALGNSNRTAQAAQWKALEKEAAAKFWVLPTTTTKDQTAWGSGIGGLYFWLPQATPDYIKLFVK